MPWRIWFSTITASITPSLPAAASFAAFLKASLYGESGYSLLGLSRSFFIGDLVVLGSGEVTGDGEGEHEVYCGEFTSSLLNSSTLFSSGG